jgi:hypothetical protein
MNRLTLDQLYDTTPIDEAWAKSLPFWKSYDHITLKGYYFGNEEDFFIKHIEIRFYDCGKDGWSVMVAIGHNAIENPTRGQFLCFCVALGIDLGEAR